VGRGRAACTGIGVGILSGDDGGVLRSVDGNRLETVEIDKSEGDGGVGISTGDCR